MTIYEKVQELAKKNGFSIREVERKAGLENGTISKWIGNVSPRFENALKVADVLGIDVNELAVSKEEP